MALVSRLLEVLVILWRSVEKALKLNEEAQKYTYAKFGNVMAKYFQAFEVLQPAFAVSFTISYSSMNTVKLSCFVFQDEKCAVPLIQMASFMPPAAIPTFR